MDMRNDDRVKHIVMWNLLADTEGKKTGSIEAVKTKFEALRGVVPGLLYVEVGVDFSCVDYACDVVLYTEFENAEALAAYAEHPAHLRIRDELQGLRVERYQVDYRPNAEQ
ncbi:Dabb family protein [Agrobacterium tumefaciens]